MQFEREREREREREMLCNYHVMVINEGAELRFSDIIGVISYYRSFAHVHYGR